MGVINKREQRGEVSQDSEASGFVWDSRGYIVTNYHCIQPVLNDRAGNMVSFLFAWQQSLIELQPFVRHSF